MAVAIIVGMIILCINAIGAALMKNAAVMKGYGDDLHAWAICFWLGIFGYLYIIALPDKVLQEQNQQIITLLGKNGESGENK